MTVATLFENSSYLTYFIFLSQIGDKIYLVCFTRFMRIFYEMKHMQCFKKYNTLHKYILLLFQTQYWFITNLEGDPRRCAGSRKWDRQGKVANTESDLLYNYLLLWAWCFWVNLRASVEQRSPRDYFCVVRKLRYLYVNTMVQGCFLLPLILWNFWPTLGRGDKDSFLDKL